MISILIPTYNEGEIIENTINKIESFISKYNKSKINIVIVDGNSKDNTVKKSENLKRIYKNLKILKSKKHLGRGIDLTKAIKKIKSDILIYMDADLSTDLIFLTELIKWLEEDYDIAIGSRILKDSKVKRPLIRKLLSHYYSLLIKLLFKVPIKDYQCGFKGFKRKKILKVLNKVKDKKWFWDTELLIRCYNEKIKIKEFPINWHHRKNSRVNIFKSIKEMSISILNFWWELNKNKSKSFV